MRGKEAWPGLRAAIFLLPLPLAFWFLDITISVMPLGLVLCCWESGGGLDRGTPGPSWETDGFPAMVDGGYTN